MNDFVELTFKIMPSRSKKSYAKKKLSKEQLCVNDEYYRVLLPNSSQTIKRKRLESPKQLSPRLFECMPNAPSGTVVAGPSISKVWPSCKVKIERLMPDIGLSYMPVAEPSGMVDAEPSMSNQPVCEVKIERLTEDEEDDDMGVQQIEPSTPTLSRESIIAAIIGDCDHDIELEFIDQYGKCEETRKIFRIGNAATGVLQCTGVKAEAEDTSTSMESNHGIVNGDHLSDVEVKAEGTSMSFETNYGVVNGDHRNDVEAEAEITSMSLKTNHGIVNGSVGENTPLAKKAAKNVHVIDSDDDMDVGGSATNYLSISMTGRDASAEPACLSNLSNYQLKVLKLMDAQNDQAISHLAPAKTKLFEWKNEEKTFKAQREMFTGKSGPTFPITKKTSILDVFHKMIDTDFVDMICTETNRYASQRIASLKKKGKLTDKSRLHNWVPTNRDDMYGFLAVHILQGLYPCNAEEKYFSFNGFGTLKYFSKIMSYNRFQLLKQLLHFNNNEQIPNERTSKARLCKINPVTDYFNDKFSSLYAPSQELVFEESTLKCHGRQNFTQKILTRAKPVGLRMYELCDSSTGYLWKYHIRASKPPKSPKRKVSDLESLEDQTDDEMDKTLHQCKSKSDDDGSDSRFSNASALIAYQLVEPLFNRGHTLIMDHFHNSPLIARCLKRKGTDCYGTLRLYRENVPDAFKTFTHADVRRNEVIASYCSDLSVMVWRDANLVGMISTYHTHEVGCKPKKFLTFKPKIVVDYNKSMAGVDRRNQILTALPMARCRNRVWYRKLFRHLFNVAIHNCYIIFCNNNPTITQRKFRTLLAEGLLKVHRQIVLYPSSYSIPKRAVFTQEKVEDDHFPTKIDSKARCRWCAERKIDSRTTWKCMQCQVSLCILVCFREYHKQPTFLVPKPIK